MRMRTRSQKRAPPALSGGRASFQPVALSMWSKIWNGRSAAKPQPKIVNSPQMRAGSNLYRRYRNVAAPRTTTMRVKIARERVSMAVPRARPRRDGPAARPRGRGGRASGPRRARRPVVDVGDRLDHRVGELQAPAGLADRLAEPEVVRQVIGEVLEAAAGLER